MTILRQEVLKLYKSCPIYINNLKYSGRRFLTDGVGAKSRKKIDEEYEDCHKTKKTFKFKNAYGLPPLFNEQNYIQAEEDGKLESLSFKPIRFARIWESDSPLYDETFEKYIRCTMYDGRRDLKYHLLNDTFYYIKCIQLPRLRKLKEQGEKSASNSNEEETTLETDPMVLFRTAIENCKPSVITRKIKRGGATYEVPCTISDSQREWYAMRWLNSMVLDRPKPRTKGYSYVLAQEIIDAASNRGKVVKKKDDIHRLAVANKAYAHYRWG